MWLRVARVISFLTDKVNTYFYNFFRPLLNHKWTLINTNLVEKGGHGLRE